MIFSFQLFSVIACALLARHVVSHPGEDHTAEIEQRSAYLQQAAKRSLGHCAEALKSRGVEQKSHLRRRELAENLRERQGIEPAPYLRARDLDSALATSHHSDLTGLTIASAPETIFASNSSCILNPEVTGGPYYVQGELVRQNVTESQPGVPLTVDIQIIDVNTCQPVPSIYLDFWHCNSTGVYSGVNANGNGNSGDTSNLDATFLRGISTSDADGVVTVNSIFPGFYTGRATHIHVMSHLNVTLNANKTLSGTGQIAHVGQMFFDQDLITQVNTVSPYKSNTQTQTQNSDDSILSQAAADVDPIMEYVLLGDSISDGILAWTTIGINITSNYTVSAAATIYESGGVANANGGMGGGGSGGPGGAMPSGGMPGGNGTIGSGTASASGTGTVTTDGVASASSTATSSGSASSGAIRRNQAPVYVGLFVGWATLLVTAFFTL